MPQLTQLPHTDLEAVSAVQLHNTMWHFAEAQRESFFLSLFRQQRDSTIAPVTAADVQQSDHKALVHLVAFLIFQPHLPVFIQLMNWAQLALGDLSESHDNRWSYIGGDYKPVNNSEVFSVALFMIINDLPPVM